MNDRFTPSLLDRLSQEGGKANAGHHVRHANLGEMKASVARDLEALLNTRHAQDVADFLGFPLATASIMAFGIADFSSKSLANPDHRGEICRSIEAAIAAHEPRLKEVGVNLSVEALNINKLNFIINATLMLQQGSELVSFDAMLQPTTLQYSISPGRPANHMGGR